MTKIYFTKQEAQAVAELIWSLIDRNGAANSNELDYFHNQALTELSIAREEFIPVSLEQMGPVYETVRSMTYPKRQACATMLRLAVTSDGKVELNELSRLNEILEQSSLFRPDPENRPKDEGHF